MSVIEIGTLADWFSGSATVFAACVALYLGFRKPTNLLINLQPHNIGPFPGNSLTLFITNSGSQLTLIRTIRLRVSIVYWLISSISFVLPNDWYEGSLPKVIKPGDVASVVLHPSPLIKDDQASHWVLKLINRGRLQFWKQPIFQHLVLITYTEDGQKFKCRLKGEIRHRMRNALVI